MWGRAREEYVDWGRCFTFWVGGGAGGVQGMGVRGSVPDADPHNFSGSVSEIFPRIRILICS